MIVNPAGSRTGGLLAQIQAERAQLAGNISPANQPGSPIRQLTQAPSLQQESQGSSRVTAVKPNLGTADLSALPPSTPGTPAASATPVAVPGAMPVLGARIPPPPPPGQPAAPQAPAAPTSPAQVTPPPAPARPVVPTATRAPGQVLGISTAANFRQPVTRRITNRAIVQSNPPRLGTGLSYEA